MNTTNSAIDAYRERRKKRLDAREWNESEHLRGKDGKFASSGEAKVPEKIQKIIDTSYYTREHKMDEIAKSLGRMQIGTKFKITDDRGVVHKFEKVDKGENGWHEQIKTKDGWSPSTPTRRSLIGAKLLAQK
jgi:hypothetical protein